MNEVNLKKKNNTNIWFYARISKFI